jgi:hypothetical protein
MIFDDVGMLAEEVVAAEVDEAFCCSRAISASKLWSSCCNEAIVAVCADTMTGNATEKVTMESATIDLKCDIPVRR